MAGLPPQTWLLAAAASLPGLILAVAFYRAHKDDSPGSHADPDA